MGIISGPIWGSFAVRLGTEGSVRACNLLASSVEFSLICFQSAMFAVNFVCVALNGPLFLFSLVFKFGASPVFLWQPPYCSQ